MNPSQRKPSVTSPVSQISRQYRLYLGRMDDPPHAVASPTAESFSFLPVSSIVQILHFTLSRRVGRRRQYTGESQHEPHLGRPSVTRFQRVLPVTAGRSSLRVRLAEGSVEGMIRWRL